MCLQWVTVCLFTITHVTAQNVQWRVSCVTEADGTPKLHLINLADAETTFKLHCAYQNKHIVVKPQSTYIEEVSFRRVTEDTCILFEPSSTTFSVNLDISLPGKTDDFFLYTEYCSLSPGVDKSFTLHTNCEADMEGFVTLTLQNNRDVDIMTSVTCSSSIITRTVSARSELLIPAVYAERPDQDNRGNACVLTDFSNGIYNVYYVATVTGDLHTRIYGYIYCDPVASVGVEQPEEYVHDVIVGKAASRRVHDITSRLGGGASGWVIGLGPGHDDGSGDEDPVFTEDVPIVHLIPNCPPTSSGDPDLELRSDVPAYALARCRNGDAAFQTIDFVSYTLDGNFDQDYSGVDCQFYKKDGSNTYTVDVEVGWGETGREVFLYQKIHTITCAYDEHGLANSTVERISDWFIAPHEIQRLMSGNTTGTFELEVLDVLDRQITLPQIEIGRKIRLKATDTTGTLPAFRALSCVAMNEVTSYAILRAGCGDGIVFKKRSGFVTEDDTVYSPYFGAFKLRGSNNIHFRCRFTVCGSGSCDGDSCSTVGEDRPRRSVLDDLQESINGYSRTYALRSSNKT